MTINVAEVRFYFSFTWIYILPTLRLNSSITYYTLIASPGYIIAIVGEEHEPISYKLDLCVWYIRPVITLQRCTSSFVDIRPLLLDTLAVPGGGGYSVIRNPVKATISEHKSLLHEDSYRLGGSKSSWEVYSMKQPSIPSHWFFWLSKQAIEYQVGTRVFYPNSVMIFAWRDNIRGTFAAFWRRKWVEEHTMVFWSQTSPPPRNLPFSYYISHEWHTCGSYNQIQWRGPICSRSRGLGIILRLAGLSGQIFLESGYTSLQGIAETTQQLED